MTSRVFKSLLGLLFASFASAVEIVAHRGASADAPENTLPAFELAWELGADVVEGDFFLTKDDEIVCFHDRTTGRVAGKNMAVADSDYAQLSALDVGGWLHPKWAGTRIPTLSQVLQSVPADRGRVFIEIKDSVRIVKPLAEQLKNSPLPTSRLAIICFKEDVVSACKKAMPNVKVHWLVSGKTYKQQGIAGVIKTLKEMGADGIDIQASTAVTAELGEALRKEGLEFHCWTVNDVALARHMITAGVDSITTDRPGFLRRWALAEKSDSHVLQHLSFDDDSGNAAGIYGGGLADRIVKTGKTLPKTGTVALWYRPVEWYDYQSIFDNTSDPDVWELWISKSAEIGFRTTAKDVRLTHRLHPIAARDQWQHIAVTWDDRAVRLYINGASVATAKRKQPSAPDGQFCLGGGNAGNTPAKGSWDEVVVLDLALSASEVRTLMFDGPGSLAQQSDQH
jgi:glycerophosphoryl diester phosphodiesterase